jgi:hypothetical protein
VIQFSQQCHLFGAETGAVWRQIHLLVPAEQAVHRAEQVRALQLAG